MTMDAKKTYMIWRESRGFFSALRWDTKKLYVWSMISGDLLYTQDCQSTLEEFIKYFEDEDQEFQWKVFGSDDPADNSFKKNFYNKKDHSLNLIYKPLTETASSRQMPAHEGTKMRVIKSSDINLTKFGFVILKLNDGTPGKFKLTVEAMFEHKLHT